MCARRVCAGQTPAAACLARRVTCSSTVAGEAARPQGPRRGRPWSGRRRHQRRRRPRPAGQQRSAQPARRRRLLGPRGRPVGQRGQLLSRRSWPEDERRAVASQHRMWCRPHTECVGPGPAAASTCGRLAILRRILKIAKIRARERAAGCSPALHQVLELFRTHRASRRTERAAAPVGSSATASLRSAQDERPEPPAIPLPGNDWQALRGPSRGQSRQTVSASAEARTASECVPPPPTQPLPTHLPTPTTQSGQVGSDATQPEPTGSGCIMTAAWCRQVTKPTSKQRTTAPAAAAPPKGRTYIIPPRDTRIVALLTCAC